ncbi:hypothetical protein HMPREF3159_03600 [Brachybacterium sp. HMSC06H03]|uniref:hypothetical protein n=1 Tax=Brachybacterium sp. HMSC06H03 TaxID=1581127 RepID=UPI0008A38C3B|nr:hypothetical protein [Brachybacterium sp. HMSC06H03]OFT62610.1 hypothetical protein HMPREF3159_03600 [Brachybacterium sp. HMSC06H03]
MTRKPTFNEYATQCYHQLIASNENADRRELLAEAASEAALAVEARHCLPPEATTAARAAIEEYDDRQGRAADKILAALADGDVDTPTGWRSAEIKRTIAVLGNGRRKLVGALTAEDLDYMVENRRANHARATASLAAFSENVNAVSPTITLHGTVSGALDAGEFRDSTTKTVNLTPAKGKRIIARKSKTA